MSLKHLSDKALHETLSSLAQSERNITLQVLHHLREVERRSLFAKLSYPSLFEYAVNELKYSASAAQRRISSMRLLKEIPELEAKVESGALPLSTLSIAQSFFRQEKTPLTEKREILSTLENKSSRDVEKELVSRTSKPHRFVKEKIRPVSSTHSELKFLVDDSFLKEIEELKTLLSHKMQNASLKDLMSFALKKALKELRMKADRGKKITEKLTEKIPTSVVTSAAKQARKISRYIPAAVKRQVWQRDQGQCSFSTNGKRCCAKSNLEFDHIRPYALAGKATEDNLRLRCRTHNQLAAITIFGEHKMGKYLDRLN